MTIKSIKNRQKVSSGANICSTFLAFHSLEENGRVVFNLAAAPTSFPDGAINMSPQLIMAGSSVQRLGDGR